MLNCEEWLRRGWSELLYSEDSVDWIELAITGISYSNNRVMARIYWVSKTCLYVKKKVVKPIYIFLFFSLERTVLFTYVGFKRMPEFRAKLPPDPSRTQALKRFFSKTSSVKRWKVLPPYFKNLCRNRESSLLMWHQLIATITSGSVTQLLKFC